MQVIVQQLRFTNPLIIIKSVPSCLCRTRTLEDNAGILMIAEPHAPPDPKLPSFFQAHQHTNWGVTTQVDPSSASQVGTGPASVSSVEVLSPWLDWSGHKKLDYWPDISVQWKSNPVVSFSWDANRLFGLLSYGIRSLQLEDGILILELKYFKPFQGPS